MDEVALRRPTLDDAFIALTGQPAESQAFEEPQAFEEQAFEEPQELAA